MKESVALGSVAEQVSPPGPLQVRCTHEDKRFQPGQELSWSPRRDHSGGAIELDPSCTFQEILGFGAALTDAACYLLHQLPPLKRREFLREVFDPAAMGLNTCRICIGSSDYATALYSYDEGDPDPEMERFSIDHDREYILPIVQEIKKFCPDLFLLASPWSPPGWMKVGGSMMGGSIQRKHFPAYTNYFLKFIESYATAGVPIHAVTVQNEVDTDQEGLMPACFWGQGSEVRFVAEHLGPCFAKHGINSKIWILDHNYDLWGRALCELADPGVNKFVDGIAWHGYAGQPDAMTLVRNAYPDKHMYWTEGGPEDLCDPRLQTNWAHWGSKFADILSNWSRCIIAWNLLLDENGKPNIGPFRCAGLVTVDSQTNDITPNGQYWALAHYSRAVRPGARRIQSQGTLPSVSHVAFRNAGGDCAMVLTNAGAAGTVFICVSNSEVEIHLPADSIATLTWGNERRGEK